MDDHVLSHKQLKLSFLTGTLDGGGAEKLQLILSDYFAKKGIDTDLVAFQKVGSLVHQIPSSIHFTDLKVKRIVTSLPIYRNYLKDHTSRIIISSVMRPNIIACLGKIFHKKSHKLIIRIDSAPFNGVSLLKQPKHCVLLGLCMLTYPFADAIVCISQAMREQILSFPFIRKEKVHLIYNPVLAPSYNEKLHEPLPERALALFSDGVPVILAVGRLHPAKDYPTMLRAFALVRQQMECRLVILGEGALLHELMALSESLGITESVHFVGFIDNPLPWMHHADLFVLSSIYEGLSGVLIEALASGTPVISTDCPTGCAEILNNGEFGDLVTVGDHKALAESMIKNVMTPKTPIADALRQHVQQFHSDVAGTSYLALIQSL